MGWGDKLKSAMDKLKGATADDPSILPSLQEKKKNIDQYKASIAEPATQPAPTAAPAKPEPRSAYGTRPGEKVIDVSDMTKPLGQSTLGQKIARSK